MGSKTETAIKVKQLSKRYRISSEERTNDTFVGALGSLVWNPMRNFRNLQYLSRFDDNEDTDDVLWALRDVNFEIKKGEVVGIIGRNGAGKSTLLKLLSKIAYPSSGRIEIFGRVASLLEVGTGFHPELTGRENIYLNGTILGMKKGEIDKKFDEIIEFSGVEGFLDTPVKRFSSGMRVRLAFSVAAHLDPEILLIDEVLSVGDLEFQKKSLGKMNEVADTGRTVLFVSHNMGAVLSLCQKGLFLDQGRLRAAGDINYVVNQYIDSVNMRNELLEPPEGEAIVFHGISIKEATQNQISFNQNFVVQIQFSNANPLKYIRMGFVVFDSKGNRIVHSYEDIRNLNETGEHLIEVGVPNIWLSPGLYSIEIAAKVLGEESLDGVYSAPTTAMLVSGEEKRFDNILSPDVAWRLLR